MVFSDRVKEYAAGPGTGNVTLSLGPVVGFQSFNGAFANNAVIEGYVIEGVDVNGTPTGQWETGIGQFVTNSTANTLIRSIVFNNSAGTPGTAMNISAANVFVYCETSACNFVYIQWSEIGAV